MKEPPDRTSDEPVDLRAHRRRPTSLRPSMAQGPINGRPGDDPVGAAAADVPLRLAAWLAAVSLEAGPPAPAHDAPTSVPTRTDPLPSPRSVH